jgi:hypothetical protein
MAAAENNYAERVLVHQVEEAIAEIRARAGTGQCPAHEPLARGVMVLLECQAAQLRNGKRSTVGWAVGAGSVAGSVLVGIVEALKHLAS